MGLPQVWLSFQSNVELKQSHTQNQLPPCITLLIRKGPFDRFQLVTDTLLSSKAIHVLISEVFLPYQE